jgi:transposase InsO family protein
LATVIDLHSRRLAGRAIADHMRTDLVIDALTAAQRTRGILDGAVMHTDHGAQYTSRAFAAACATAGIRQSMTTPSPNHSTPPSNVRPCKAAPLPTNEKPG